MFSLIHGNRQEILARHLATQLADRPLPLFEREILVVQSGGMARWLQMFLAEELGLAAQLRFTFPAAYLWELFGTVLPDVPKDSPFSRDILIWQLLRLMQTAPRDAAFAPLHHYLADGDQNKRHGLAQRLAETFDNYLAYRPEWVGSWLSGKQIGLGEHEAWQAWLWHQIGEEAAELPEAHPAQLFFTALETNPAKISLLPKRLSIFGSGAMPPPYLDIFKRLGRHIDIAFYLVNPCREHWGELVSERAKARAALETPQLLESFEVGQPLLGSLGRITRNTFEYLLGENDVELFAEPSGNKLLGVLHADILEMRERQADERIALAADDGSIQFHVCHSATREIEVLHDRLLALFSADPALRPHDVLVLTPDIVSIAPLIEAVFAAAQNKHSIPFTIADRPLELEAPLLRACNALLDLSSSRCDAESVLNVLAHPCIAARFGFDEESLELVRAWVGRSGIRWGFSGAARAEHGLPADDAHSWRFGLRRMLLGMALTEKDGKLFQEQLPFDAIEGVRTQVLGRLLGFMDELEAAMQQLKEACSVGEWAALLPALCERFCAVHNTDISAQAALQTLRSSLQQLAQSAAKARCDEAVPLAVLRRELDAHLAAMPPAWAFLGGGVTFAALRAYRAVPARVICLIGMNDGLFPRNPAIPGFDLLHKHTRSGDRDLRAEDRHAFFEALLSARDYLHVSYVGRGIRDDAALPPSMLVAELRDAVDTMAIDGAESVTIQHRLQPFSPHYFDGSDRRLYSHAAHYAQAALAMGRKSAAPPFLSSVLPAAPPELLEITPQQFIRFFRNPAEHLLRHRLGIHLEESEGLLDTVEPFAPAGLERYALRKQVVSEWQRGVRDPAQAMALARARGMLPHGAPGEVWFGELWNTFAPFAEQIALHGGEALPPCRIDLSAAGVSVIGSIGGLQQWQDPELGGVVHLEWRIGEIRPIDRLSLWLQHLLLHAAGQRCNSVLMTTAETWKLAPLTDANIDTLFSIYKRGCAELLPFFPATSLHWLTAQRENKATNWRKDWDPNDFGGQGECSNAYIDLAWSDSDPFTPAFEILAGQIYAPMLEHADVEEEQA